MAITFGTSGWRGIISKEFTVDNLKKVTQAIADYFLESRGSKKRILVGYDTRFMSDRFANIVAVQLAQNGIPVYLCDRDTPTPVIAYTIINKKLLGAINITASHNPPEYSGLKLSLKTGEPVSIEITKWIENRITTIKDPESGTQRNASIKKISVSAPYLKRLEKIIDIDLIKKAKLKVGIDYLYGTSQGYLDSFLKGKVSKMVCLHGDKNPSFGGGSPDPSALRLKQLGEEIKKQNLDIGLATDGDADRFGIVDRNGTFIPANYILTILFEYLLKTRPWKGGIVRSMTTTHLLDAVAESYQRAVHEVPVGFKYVGHALKEEDAVMGCEESAGMSVHGHVPEKDGVLACLLVAEVIAYYKKKKSLHEILDTIMKQYGPLYNTRTDLRIQENTRNTIIQRCSTVRDLNGIKIVSRETFSKESFRYILSKNSWVIVRPSGTEPVVRCYIETTSRSRLKLLSRAVSKLTQ